MAKYFKQEMPDLRNTGEKKFYYRMKVNENIDFDELVRRLTYPGSGLDKGQVVQVIAAIGKQMALEMASGNSVTIDGIGTFRASVGMTMPKDLTGTDTGKETNARSLKVTGHNLQGSLAAGPHDFLAMHLGTRQRAPAAQVALQQGRAYRPCRRLSERWSPSLHARR